MTARDLWTDRLSDYVDGGMDAAERAAAEAHLATCAACAATVADLRAVAARAAALPPLAPAGDLWPAIEARLEAPRRVLAFPGRRLGERRWSFSLPQLAAAGLLLVALTGASVWVALSRRPAVPAPGPAATAPATATAVQPAGFETARYDAAIADLERVLAENRSRLDPATVRTIEQNLRIIDEATDQARKALAADPANPYLNGHLADQLKRKMTVLRQATAYVAIHG